METICDHLAAEHESLDSLVAGLTESQWRMPTPAPSWSIADQISHLWFFDQRALQAFTDPDGFVQEATALLATGKTTEISVEAGRTMTGRALLDHWRADRAKLVEVARAADPSRRVPWYGPAMAARSMATARLMETWAHGVDVADTLGAQIPATDRLRHIAHLGVRARHYSYMINGLEVPDRDVYVDLLAPDGQHWTWSAPGPDAVHGSAVDFCLVVTQRRHLADGDLRCTGSAQGWMAIAQAFAGGPGTGRSAQSAATGP